MKRKDLDRLKRITIDPLVDKQTIDNAIKTYVVFLGFLMVRELKTFKNILKNHIHFQFNGEKLDFCIDIASLNEENYSFTATSVDSKRNIIIIFRFYIKNNNRFEARIYDTLTVDINYSAIIQIKKNKLG